MGLSLINASNESGEAVRAAVTVIRAPASTTFTVDAVTNWPAYFIATAGTELAGGTLDPSTVLVFAGHLSGSQIVVDTIAPGYADVGSSVNDIVVIKPNTMWADGIASLLGVSLDDDGTLNAAALASTQTAIEASTNFRPKPRLLSVATSATKDLYPDPSLYNIYEFTALDKTLNFQLPSGAPVDGDIIIIRIKDDGTSRGLGYSAFYTNISGLGLLTSTTAGKWSILGIIYNAGINKWQIVSITTEA